MGITSIIYRPHTKAYVVNNICYPSPDDETVPEAIRDQYSSGYEEIASVAQEHPELVTVENLQETPVPTLDEVKAAKLAEINTACDAILKQAVADYPVMEQATFYKQDAESAAYLASPETAETPFLTTLATARGISLATMVEKVRVKTDTFAQLSAFICGQRQALEDLLDLCETIEEVQAITVSYLFPETV